MLKQEFEKKKKKLQLNKMKIRLEEMELTLYEFDLKKENLEQDITIQKNSIEELEKELLKE